MPGKFKIIVSDLHLGAGRAAEGNRLEDFSSDDEFAAFLEEVTAESEAGQLDVELIVAGDAFEFFQVPHVEAYDPACEYPAEQYHSSAEGDSVLKMDLIIAGHSTFFDALGGFMRVGPPRRTVTIVKGNHDVNLHWGAVQARIREAAGALAGRAALLAFEERCISREGIYVEHGNQYGEIIDHVKDMEEPHDHDRPGQLAVPLGAWFVMNAFNVVERRRYWIDGVKPITALVWYALAFDFSFAAWAIAQLIRAIPEVVEHGVLSVEDSRSELVQALEDPTRVEEWAATYRSDEAFRQAFNLKVTSILSPPMELTGTHAVPLPTTSDAVKMGDRLRARVYTSLYQAARTRALEEGAKIVVFGHTHEPGAERLPGGGFYINSGTWTWSADFSGAGKQTWQDLFRHPERFTRDRTLNFVRIDYDDGGEPQGKLLVYGSPLPPRREGLWPMLQSSWEWFRAFLKRLWRRVEEGI